MPDADPRDFLSDPLSGVARSERRNLLFASTVALLVSHVGLIPTEISALGLKFASPARNAFLILTMLVVLYFIVAFVMYAIADLFVWRKRFHDYLVSREKESQSWTLQDQIEYDELHASLPSIEWYYNWAASVANTRMLFEFVLPLLVGAYAAAALLFRVWVPI